MVPAVQQDLLPPYAHSPLTLNFARQLHGRGLRSTLTTPWSTFFLRLHSNFSCRLVCLLKTTQGCNHLRWYEFWGILLLGLLACVCQILRIWQWIESLSFQCSKTFSQVSWGLIEVLYWGQLLVSSSSVPVWFVQQSGVGHDYLARCQKCSFWHWLAAGEECGVQLSASKNCCLVMPMMMAVHVEIFD